MANSFDSQRHIEEQELEREIFEGQLELDYDYELECILDDDAFEFERFADYADYEPSADEAEWGEFELMMEDQPEWM